MPGQWSDRQFVKLIGLPETRRQLLDLPKVVSKQALGALYRRSEAIAMTARAYAPRRSSTDLPGYAGGMLESHIGFGVSRRNMQSFVGIKKGVISVVGGTQFTYGQLKRTRYYIGKDGKRKKKTYSAFTDWRDREHVRVGGGRFIQPTQYAHFLEFGTRRGVSARSFMRNAARGAQSAFEADMASLAPDVIAALRSLGHNPGGTK